jgi:hypothetical protein
LIGKCKTGLAAIGASEIEHLVDLVAEDLQELGMKPLEQKRFLRSVTQWEAESDSVWEWLVERVALR